MLRNIILCTILIGLLVLMSQVEAERSPWTEDYYNRGWCSQKQGIAEYRLPDGKRIDCLTKKYAVEADWANYKSYEAIGQSLYYAKETNKIPAMLLIVKDDRGMEWVKLVSDTMRSYNIQSQVWYVIAHEKFHE